MALILAIDNMLFNDLAPLDHPRQFLQRHPRIRLARVSPATRAIENQGTEAALGRSVAAGRCQFIEVKRMSRLRPSRSESDP
jgi:hypothetical protein